jgi:hypothetical protein
MRRPAACNKASDTFMHALAPKQELELGGCSAAGAKERLTEP